MMVANNTPNIAETATANCTPTKYSTCGNSTLYFPLKLNVLFDSIAIADPTNLGWLGISKDKLMELQAVWNLSMAVRMMQDGGEEKEKVHESLLPLPLPKRVLGRVRISERVPLADATATVDATSARQLLVGASAAMVDVNWSLGTDDW